MKHVCIISDDYPPHALGGAAAIAAEHAQGLVSLGFNVTVITCTSDKKEVGTTEQMGVSVIRLYSLYPSFLRSWVSVVNFYKVVELKNILHTLKPDIIHFHNVHTNFSFAAIFFAHQYAPTFLTAHDAMMVHTTKIGSLRRISTVEKLKHARLCWNPIREQCIRYFVKNTKIATVSNALKSLLEINGVTADTVIHNGVSLDVFQSKLLNNSKHGSINNLKNTNDIYSEFSIPQGVPCIMFGGRASAAKGVYIAIKALKNIRTVSPTAVLILVGVNATMRNRIESFADSIGLSDKKSIICIPWIHRERMPELYSIATCMLVPSQYIDPFPTVIIEGMLMKVPLVVTNKGGAAEMITADCGYIGDPNTKFITQSVIDIIQNPEKASILANKSYVRAIQDFSQSAFVHRILAWYGMM